MPRILIADDERSIREYLEILLTREGWEVQTVATAAAGQTEVARSRFDVVLTDLKLGDRSGLEVLKATKAADSSTEVIVFTAFGSTDTAVEAMKLGAYDYLTKPVKNEELLLVISRALQRQSLLRENEALKRRLGEKALTGLLVAKSEPMREIIALIEKVASTRSTVLISGESGTGKELVARAIHGGGNRSGASFVAVNCGAIPEGLIESELFGHVRGAFTGAVSSAEGLFRAAEGGTLFLDEISELPQQTQVKLLRVLQERRVRPVGGAEDFEVDVRIIAATNKDLEAEVRGARFREDLFYRLNVIHIHVPALRDRKDDIPALAEYLLGRHADIAGRRPVPRLTDEALAAMHRYAFPGNVRELENVIERAVALSEGPEIDVDALPAALRTGESKARSEMTLLQPERVPDDLQAYLDAVERACLVAALEASDGGKTKAAARLGLTFRSFRYRLAKHGLGASDEEKESD
jgi:two-component system, NtrC family, response regulator PilR